MARDAAGDRGDEQTSVDSSASARTWPRSAKRGHPADSRTPHARPSPRPNAGSLGHFGRHASALLGWSARGRRCCIASRLQRCRTHTGSLVAERTSGAPVWSVTPDPPKTLAASSLGIATLSPLMMQVKSEKYSPSGTSVDVDREAVVGYRAAREPDALAVRQCVDVLQRDRPSALTARPRPQGGVIPLCDETVEGRGAHCLTLVVDR